LAAYEVPAETQLGRDTNARRQFVLVLGFQVARINHDGKIRPAADLVNVVDRLVCAPVKVGRRGADEMAAGGETDHADLPRIDAPLPGLAANQTQRTLGILEGTRSGQGLVLPRPARATVLDDDAGHADRVEPLRHLGAVQVPKEVVVAAAGTNQHRDAGIFVFCRPIDR